VLHVFFSRTTHWVLAPLADRLDQPDQASTPLSSNNPLLRRILTSVEQLLQERRMQKDEVRALSLEVAELNERAVGVNALLGDPRHYLADFYSPIGRPSKRQASIQGYLLNPNNRAAFP
jgi:hypothetical protein